MHRAQPIALLLLSLSAALLPARAAAEDDLYSRLFGEEPPAAGADDLLLVSSVIIERPEAYTEAYVASFARELKAGERLRRAELERRLAAVGERLALSGMFYSSRASYRSLDAEAGAAGERRVEAIVSVSEGFAWGFNFSPWDLRVSYGNFGGEGKAASFLAGLNGQGIAWLDPAIGNGPLSYSASLNHSVKRYASDVDPPYLAESLRGEAGIGLSLGDELRLSLGAGYLGLSSPDGYFLYPRYEAPGAGEFAALALSRSRSDYAEGLFDASLFEYGYRKEGGLRGRLAVGARAYAPLRADGTPRLGASMVKLFADGSLRLDALPPFRLELRERIEGYPWAEGRSSPPAPLRADLAEGRSVSGLASGESSSLSRASVDLRLGPPIALGCTSLEIIPQAYFELGFVRRAAFSDRAVGQASCGALLQFAFAAPVGRTFGLGLGIGLPGLPDFVGAEAARDKPSANFVFEVR